MGTIGKRANKWQVQTRRKESPAISRSFYRRCDALEWTRDMEVVADRFGMPATPVDLKDMRVEHLAHRYMSEVISGTRYKEVETSSFSALLRHRVIPPFLAGLRSRRHAAIFSFCAGVMPPMPILGRSFVIPSSDGYPPISSL